MQAEFERSLFENLEVEERMHPEMDAQDVIKFLFQGLLGPGHLLSDRERVLGHLKTEMISGEKEKGPAMTSVSPMWSRLHLASAQEMGLTPETIYGMMVTDASTETWTRDDVIELARALPGDLKRGNMDPLFEKIRAGWIPSHSARYHECYHPSYRIVPAHWEKELEALSRICLLGEGQKLVTMDGPCASGKTTIARHLSEALGIPIIHTDDFVIPHKDKTPERLAIPGGNCDATRLLDEVIRPFMDGKGFWVRKYDWTEREYKEGIWQESCPLMLLEGTYCNLPILREHAALRFYVNTSWEVRLERLKKRESPESLEQFKALWIPLENAYYEAYGIPDSDMVLIN